MPRGGPPDDEPEEEPPVREQGPLELVVAAAETLKGPSRRVELCGDDTQISPRWESAH